MRIELPEYQYNGARALVELHEQYLRRFVQTWKRARSVSLALPDTQDPNYASLETMLFHVLAAARGYMRWMCTVLDLPDPEIDKPPGVEGVATAADAYVDRIAERWAQPLANVAAERFRDREYASRWETRYCIDAMLEHAVMHPIRHDHQLRVLLGEAPTDAT